MLKLRKLLVPIDFSERAAAAVRHASGLAKQFRSRLILIHVIPPAPYEYAAFDAEILTQPPWPRDFQAVPYLTEELESFVSGLSVKQPFEKIVLEGNPAEEIIEYAKGQQVDLIVMPTHGYGPFRRFVLGSVTAKVLHDVACPVFTGAHVPDVPGPEKSRPYKLIVCAVDLREHSEAVLRWAADFAAGYDARLLVVHTVPNLDLGENVLVKGAKEKVEKLLQQTSCEAQIHVEPGDVSAAIPNFITKTGADLLVIGRSRNGGLLGRLRTHAYALIREAPCPVVSV